MLVSIAEAGPWVRAPGAWYTKVAVNRFRAGEYVVPGAAEAPAGPSYQATTASVYSELGLAPGLQLVVDAPWSWATNQFDGSTLVYRADGPGSLRAGLGYGSTRAPVSAHVLARVPLFANGAPETFAPALGEEQVDVDVVLSAGASAPAGESRLWGAADVGGRVRTGLVLASEPVVVDGGDALTGRLQLGVSPTWHGQAFGWAFVEAAGFTGVGSARRSATVSAGAAIPLGSGLHVELGGTVTPWAHLDARGSGFGLGLSHQRTSNRRTR
ncbi:MAG: hypothetical protein ABMA64_36275 [Myxococcota bacterium]